jgi:hypothetical protein
VKEVGGPWLDSLRRRGRAGRSRALRID